MAFVNLTGHAATILNGLDHITGSTFVTLLLIVILLLLLTIALRMELEVSAILILPFLLTMWAYVGDFVTVGGVTLIYLAVILAKNFFTKW